MSDPKQSIKLTIQNEGGFVDNPADRGKATKYGITQADLPGTNIADITEDQAFSYYNEHFVKPFHPQIQSQTLLDKVFDQGVVLGIGTATRIFKRALGLPPEQQTPDFDDQTLAAANIHGDSLLPAFKDKLIKHYEWIVQQDPTQSVFLDGWKRRVNS